MKKYEYRKLRGRIVERYGTMKKFAEEMDISEVSLSNKLNCVTGISQSDIERWSAALGIEVAEYGAFYFA